MVRARAAILRAGGAAAVNVFTRIQLALFAAGPWATVPTMPPELILAPRWFPVHLSKMAYWARTVIVPLLVLGALKPVARNPRGVKVDELYLPQGDGQAEVERRRGQALLEGRVRRARRRAQGRRRAVAEGPAPARDRPLRRVRRRAPERRRRPRRDLPGDGEQRDDVRRARRHRPPRHRPRRGREADRPARGRRDLLPAVLLAGVGHRARRARDARGPLARGRGGGGQGPRLADPAAGARRSAATGPTTPPTCAPAAGRSSTNNAHYPDLDDTAAVVCALDRARGRAGAKYDEAIARGTEWTVGLQIEGRRLGRVRRRQQLSLPQQHPVRRPRRAARSADRRRQRAVRVDAGAARRAGRVGADARRRSPIWSRSRRPTAAGSGAGGSTTSTARGRRCARSTRRG